MKPCQSEATIRSVLDACADCDTCRFLMEESCLLFPELYRLHDLETGGGRPLDGRTVRDLARLCTLCGLCPCADIRADIIRSKIEGVRAGGLPLSLRLLADVQRFGRWAGRLPRAANTLLSMRPVRSAAGKLARIHPHRRLPPVAQETFFSWARRKGLHRKADHSPKVAYFAGCTAGYFFPQVAKSAVHVLQRNGIAVYVPRQQCCGMPTLLEGDLPATERRMRANMKTLLAALQDGYELVCSCPTCGYLIGTLLKEGAYYSRHYQASIRAAADEIVIPGTVAGRAGRVRLKKSIYGKILKDERYFSSLDPMGRITLSENLFDLGDYLNCLQKTDTLNGAAGELHGRMAYYAPCHQREQGIGSPYVDLLASIKGLTVIPVGGAMDCCGMGGSLGFKRDFYNASIRLAAPLVKKIKAARPQAIITDCLSCRLQFRHLLPLPVYHPVELLRQAIR